MKAGEEMKGCLAGLAFGGIIAMLIFAVVSVVYLTYDMTSAERCLKYGKCALLPSR